MIITPSILNGKFLKKIKNVILATCSIGLAVSLAPAQAQQQQGNVAASGWFKTCSEQNGSEFCNVQFRVVARQGGQVITSLNLIEVKGEVNRRLFRVIVPTGRSLPPGLQVQVDDKRAVTIPYTYCRQSLCGAEAQLNDELVEIFKKGGSLRVTSINFQDKPNPVSITLKGFTAAYDGDPIKPEETTSREEQLRKELEEKLKKQQSE